MKNPLIEYSRVKNMSIEFLCGKRANYILLKVLFLMCNILVH